MPIIEDVIPIARKVLPIIFVIDTSGSMAGERIASLNEAMHDVKDTLVKIAESNSDAELKIGVLEFASGAEWITKNGLVYLDDFFWNDLRAAGVTDFGSALKELDDKLSRHKFLISETGFCKPVLIFMSDGEPTDDFEKALERIKRNKWFNAAIKIAIAVGDDADLTVLRRIAGEAVIKVNDQEALKKSIGKVASVSSLIGSTSKVSSDEDDVAQIMEEVKQAMEKDGLQIETGDTLFDPEEPFDQPLIDVDPSEYSDEPAEGGWDEDGWND